MTAFVHLRLHTEYSLVDSVVRIPELVKAVARAGMPAVAVTDQVNLFAMVKFYREAMAQGVKPVIGVDLLVAERGERAQPSRIALLCMDERGYRNLTTLVSRAYIDGRQRDLPLIERDWLGAEGLAGLIALSCGADGDVGRALALGKSADAARHLAFWRERFGDRYYLEVSRVGREGEEALLAATVALAAAERVPLVATNDVRFLAPEDFEAHEARVCIHEGVQLADPGRSRRYTPQQYLRTPAEMAELFADLPEALANSVAIARRCSLALHLGESRLPAFPVPDGGSIEEFLRTEAARGLTSRLARLPSAGQVAADRPTYEARLQAELAVICQMGFAGYFLIVADFIRWARANGVPVGPGRGSGAGSLVAYSLGITDIDPLQYDLLFERFL
ncbi:MAG: PHP domain-containing protein, partial [Gammaproteobacteria bacterium]